LCVRTVVWPERRIFPSVLAEGGDSNPRHGLSPCNGLANHLATSPIVANKPGIACDFALYGTRTARLRRTSRRFYRHATRHSRNDKRPGEAGLGSGAPVRMRTTTGTRKAVQPIRCACDCCRSGRPDAGPPLRQTAGQSTIASSRSLRSGWRDDGVVRQPAGYDPGTSLNRPKVRRELTGRQGAPAPNGDPDRVPSARMLGSELRDSERRQMPNGSVSGIES
jgi:hypothetical protein